MIRMDIKSRLIQALAKKYSMINMAIEFREIFMENLLSMIPKII